MKYAGFWIRAWAYSIDTMILWLGQYLLLVVTVGSFQKALGLLATPQPIGILLGIFGFSFYFSLFESGSWQATPGKRIAGLRVVKLAGDRIRFWQAVGRYFGKYLSSFLLGIGYIMAGTSDKKQALHDRMANTLVLYGRAGVDSVETPVEPRYPVHQEGSFVVGSASSKSWVMAGFDDNGHVVRLSFSHEDPKLSADGLIIGRYTQSSDLHINDQSVSRRHAKLFKKVNAVWIADLGSTNGISINGVYVAKNGSTQLPEQGTIVIGAVELSIGKY